MSEDNVSSDEAQGGKTIIYGFAREAITRSDLETLRDALDAEGYALVAGDSGNLMVKRQEEGAAVDVTDVLG